MNYEKEIEKLCDALDVIAKFEDGDNIHLKRKIRAEIERLEKIIEELELLNN